MWAHFTVFKYRFEASKENVVQSARKVSVVCRVHRGPTGATATMVSAECEDHRVHLD